MDDLLKALRNRDKALNWLKTIISREYRIDLKRSNLN